MGKVNGFLVSFDGSNKEKDLLKIVKGEHEKVLLPGGSSLMKTALISYLTTMGYIINDNGVNPPSIVNNSIKEIVNNEHIDKKITKQVIEQHIEINEDKKSDDSEKLIIEDDENLGIIE